MAPTTVLITGANRGLGKGLLERYLSQPNHTVVAAVRDPSHSTSQALSSIAKADDSKLVVVKYDAGVEQDAHDVAETLQKTHGIDKLDVVIANAAIAKGFVPIKEAKRSDVLEHVNVNVLGVLSLFQATRELLERAAADASPGEKPVFAIIGTVAGSMGGMMDIPNAVYGASKVMAHWYGLRLHKEEEWLSTLVIHPGWVQTEMGNFAAGLLGVSEAPVTVDDSVNGMFSILTDKDSKAKYGGKLVVYDKTFLDW
ncbi:hypothetical protein MCOR27_000526 [Pyricularia oryzae]|nr:hypothetical protein MCOR26_004022 [Pyricularia oryzae]KAI6288958.1 hypothetical protein MCOR27_000526 [Pyricularia oryzae]KAI6322098.1 hypothetical protein MCOR29_004889 [Pyricularia oryzae]KAI6344159.1 hypothetical protein MCOR28_004395 [Pyricularia oryzae]KAI6348868.1 hypothetical protein MCOR30_000135 [Pyricularia oryzae]